MKFQPGDIVLVLHSNEEGEVVDIINDKMVMVDVRGVQFPVIWTRLIFLILNGLRKKNFFQAKKKKNMWMM